jgi:protein SCO1/2
MTAALVALLLAQGTPPQAAAPRAPAEAGAGVDNPQGAVDVVEKLGDPMPDARFHDQAMDLISLRDAAARGKPTVLTLIYFECPMLCSLVQKGVVKALNETGLVLGKDYYGLTASFSPRDTPRDAAEKQLGYLQTLAGARDPKDWPFLTGGPQAITALADAVGFRYRYDEESQQFEHPAVSVVLTPEGKVSRYFYGVEIAPRDLKLALVEASQGKVGTTLDRVLLKCFRYDPASRKYRLYVWSVLRGGSVAVAIGLIGMLGFLWRREVKKGTVA